MSLRVRRMEHADLPKLDRLMQMETLMLFGQLNLGLIYEMSCLSMVQCNERREVVSGICLCNYPNVPSVIPQDWPTWLVTLYGLENVTERNAMFVHFLVWNRQYTGCFFEGLLTEVFDVASYLQHVILVLPPQVIPVDVFEGQMIRISSNGLEDTYSVQSLYVTVRHLNHSRLRIRRVVEEDNDLVIPIIDAESSLLKEYYGEYYVSEMVRYPNDYRQLIVSEDNEGLATGVMFLNSTVDVDVLNENFELGPYNGFRKPSSKDEIPPEYMESYSETFFSIFSRRPRPDTMHRDVVYSMTISPVQSREDLEKSMESSVSTESMDLRLVQEKIMDTTTLEPTLSNDLSTISEHFSTYHRRKMMTSVFGDTLFYIPPIKFLDFGHFDEGKTVIPEITASEILLGEDIQLPSQPIYRGKVNAFVLEIFAMQKEIKTRCSKNFLEAAFECFPDLDYCVILMPSFHPYMRFLENFVRVPLRCNKDYPMTLYTTHRAALLGRITCREGVPDDWNNVRELLHRIPRMVDILRDFDAAVKKQCSNLCYVFQWNDTIVGVAILCIETDVTYIRRRYHVEDYVSTRNVPRDAYGCILHFVIMPIFSIHLRYFFCEIMRLSGLMVLYYRLVESALSALTRSQALATCLNVMVSIIPRRRIEYKFLGYKETDEPQMKNEPFALFMTTPRLAMLNNLIDDTKVVVVGASDCGVAILEHLALGSTLEPTRFANLTLISPNGLPFENDHDPEITSKFPFRGRYCPEYRRLVATRAWINVVYGTVVRINRQEKYVTVMNQGNIAYDYLLLTCGLQYQRPRFHKELEAQKKGTFHDQETPWNCLTINDITQAVTCLRKLRLLTNNLQDEKKIIFYGHNIDCYCALQGFLEVGIHGSCITLITPLLDLCESRENVFFNDCEVYTEVMNSLSKIGVTILLHWELVDWHLKESIEGQLIEAIVLRSKNTTRTLECDALVNFNEKTINMKIFLAICRSGLMFDGQLVIDPEFRMNDPAVFAAGTITKYCRRFSAESWQHKYYNSVEIGERVAKVLRSTIDAQQRGIEKRPVLTKGKNYLTLPLFHSPNIVACTLPGGYHYLHIRKPGKIIDRKIALRYKFYGSVMVTGSCKAEIGYFRIRLNRFDSIETITCCSKKDYEIRHIIALYGKHESLLNDVKTRFQKSLITDFYAYFREPWAMAIFYDRFECLRIENRATLLSKTMVPNQSLIDDCINALKRSNWNAISKNDRRLIEERYAGSIYQQELEENLLDFLNFCEEDVPVYCTPGKLRELYAIGNSPLYMKQ